MDTIIVVLVYAVILLLLFFGFYQLFQSMSLREVVKERMDKIYTDLASKDRRRVDEIELERRQYGTVGGKNGSSINKVLDKIDNLIIYSGWGVKYVWLNTSTYIAVTVLFMCLVFMTVLVFFGNIVLAFFSMLMVVIIPIVRMTMLADRAYKCTEKQLTLFVNNVANMSASTNNIVTVVADVTRYMTYPLNTAMERAVATAKLTGDDSACVRQLCREIEHPLFVRFLRHLEICSRNDSDFKTVARDYSGQVDQALKAAQRQKQIFANGKGNITSLLIISLVMIAMMASYTGMGFMEMLIDMSHDIFGAVVLIFTGIIYLVAILYMVLGMRR